MESYAVLIPLIIFGYLLGSVPTGLVVARLFNGVDPRQAGSGNLGATNVARTSGKAAGLLTLAGDVAKGAVPVIVALYMGYDSNYSTFVNLGSLVGFAAFAGHLFPIFLKFRGGKGVATACGVFLILSPPALFISLGVFVVLLGITRYVSIGSMGAAIAIPIVLRVFHTPYVPLGIAVCIMIILKHSANIKRLGRGEENRLW